MNKISEDKLKELKAKGKDPIKYFIEINKFLASKEYIGQSKEVDWVISKEVVLEILKMINDGKEETN